MEINGLMKNVNNYASNKFNLFAPIDINTGYKKAHTVTARPISNTNSNGPYNFEFGATPDKFTDAKSLELCGRVRIIERKKNSTDIQTLTVNDNVSTINNIFHSLYSSIDVYVNDLLITDPSSNWYSYRSYIERLLTFSKNTKVLNLSASGYFQDSHKQYDVMSNENDGWKKRRLMFTNGDWVDFKELLQVDLATAKRYLPPNIRIKVTLHRNSDEFCLLMADSITKQYEIQLDELQMNLVKYDPDDELMNYHLKEMQISTPIIPFDRSFIKTFTVQKGTSDLSRYNIINGQQLPEQIYVMMVDETSYIGILSILIIFIKSTNQILFTGAKNKNPFNFKNNDMDKCYLLVNGEREPLNPIRFDASNNRTRAAYSSLLQSVGIDNYDDRDIGINLYDFINGCFIIGFDRTIDKCNRFHTHPMSGGSIDLYLKLHTNLTESIRVIVYSSYSSYLTFDKNYNVYMQGF